MSGLTVSDEHAASDQGEGHPAGLGRALHWINAFAMVLMIMSGWQIYNASPLFGFSFSASITLGGWLAGGLLWHFAAMWLLMVNGLSIFLGLATGRFRKKLLPITPAGVMADTKAALTGKLSHEDLTNYNQVQKLLYGGHHRGWDSDRAVRPLNLEAGAASLSHGFLRRLRFRPLRAFRVHGLDRRILS